LFLPYETPVNIERDINDYIDKIEIHTKTLEESYGKKNTANFISAMEAIKNMLQLVYAKQCEALAIVLIRTAKDNGLEYCRQLLSQAIADFILLSIEMQKAQNLNTTDKPAYNEIEKDEEVSRSLSAIGNLISTGDYDKAKSIAADRVDMDDSFVKVSSMLDSRQYDKAGELAKVAETEHIGHIMNAGAAKSAKTVLAVDDRPEILANVSAALKNHYRVIGAPSGKLALELIGKNKIALFFLDIDMPEMDGFELCGRIRSDINHTRTPIIFLTSNSSREHILRATKLNINEFIVKPAYNVTLLAKARKYLD
jgi:PleD family two-component response regulator